MLWMLSLQKFKKSLREKKKKEREKSIEGKQIQKCNFFFRYFPGMKFLDAGKVFRRSMIS